MDLFVLAVIGLVIGTLVILFGSGGAAFYLGILTGFFGLKGSVASSTSVVTALPALVLGAWRYYRQGQINTKVGNQMLIAALPAVVVGSFFAKFIPDAAYTWLIGLILIALGISMLIQDYHNGHKKDSTEISATHPKLKAGLYGALAGLMVGVAGMSGGAVILAGLFLLGLEAFNATATSTYVLVFMTAVGAFFHTASGQVDWHVGIPLIIGSCLGAVIAPLIASKLAKSSSSGWMKPLIALINIFLGVKSLI